MDFAESAEQQHLRTAVAAVAGRYGHGYWLGKARAGEKTTELWDEVGRLGYLGVAVPEEYGGGGQGIAELAIVAEELAAAGCPLLLLVVSPAICATVIARSGTTAQKERWLPGLASGEITMAFAITEPDAGSNSHKLSTVATRDGSDWVLSGRKTYISGVDEAEAVLVVAGLNPERITGAAVANGIGRYALAKASAYANDRPVWGVPVGAHQGVSHPLANAAIQVELARLMTAKAGWLHDRGADAGEAANMAKYAAAEAALLALDHAIQTHGGNGLATGYGLATLWGATRLVRIAPISREMILNFVATHTLGLPRSY